MCVSVEYIFCCHVVWHVVCFPSQNWRGLLQGLCLPMAQGSDDCDKPPADKRLSRFNSMCAGGEAMLCPCEGVVYLDMCHNGQQIVTHAANLRCQQLPEEGPSWDLVVWDDNDKHG